MRSDRFGYEPLPTPSSIRVLRIEPAAASDPIHCKFQTVDFDNLPDFKALSYSWQKDPPLFSTFFIKGQAVGLGIFPLAFKAFLDKSGGGPEDYYLLNVKAFNDFRALFDKGEMGNAQPIFCYGRTTMVQSNLYEALVRLRRLPPADYWIDALCINQEDLAERSEQVQMMGRIYGCAEEVVVWLGTSPTLAIPWFHLLVRTFGPKAQKSKSTIRKCDRYSGDPNK
jgi:hypothetical protein